MTMCKNLEWEETGFKDDWGQMIAYPVCGHTGCDHPYCCSDVADGDVCSNFISDEKDPATLVCVLCGTTDETSMEKIEENPTCYACGGDQAVYKNGKLHQLPF